MSDFSRFMKKNKIERKNTTYAATKSLVDEKGNPLLWTIKPLSTEENEKIRESCTKEVPIKGGKGVYRSKLNTAMFTSKMITACVVEPDLYNKELQDSYGVMTPEELVKKMIDNPAEYDDFLLFIQKFNGYDVSLDEKVEQAKN